MKSSRTEVAAKRGGLLGILRSERVLPGAMLAPAVIVLATLTLFPFGYVI